MLDTERVRMRRLQLRMSQRELGKQIGLDQAYISRLEAGKIPDLSARVLERIADVLGVSVDYLLGREKVQEDDEHPALAGKA
jgi:transcriptional regulator with XRE-family HTH domain